MLKGLKSVRFLLLFAFPAFSQIDLPNSDFETGVQDWTLTGQAPDPGRLEPVSKPVQGGEGAAHVQVWDRNHWSVSPRPVTVMPGALYEFSVWVLVAGIRRPIQLAASIYDAQGEALDWSAAEMDITSESEGYRKFRTRIAVPAEGVRIHPRIIGDDSADFYLDDAEVRLVTMPARSEYAWGNEHVKVYLRVPEFSFRLQDAKGAYSLAAEAVPFFALESVDSLESGFAFHCQYLPGEFPLTMLVRLEGRDLVFDLQADSNATFPSPIRFPGRIAAGTADYLVIPYGTGLLLPAQTGYPFNQFHFSGGKSSMAFAGVTDLRTGYLLTVDQPWDALVRFERGMHEPTYSPQLLLQSAKGRFGYARTIRLQSVAGGGYVELCRGYRSLAEKRGYARTLAEKIRVQPKVDWLPGAADFWFEGLGTPSLGFMDTLGALGMDRLLASLGGSWANTDSSISPDLIDTLNDRGYLTSRYDIYTDIWEPTPITLGVGLRTLGYPGDISVDASGGMERGWVAHAGDNPPLQGYTTCAATHSPYALKWMGEDLAARRYTARFIDVEMATGLFECYSPLHPRTRREDARHRLSLMELSKNRFSLVTGGEEGREEFFPVIDFAEGNMTIQSAGGAGWHTPLKADSAFLAYNVNPAVRVPLLPLVYHDVVVSTWWTGDGGPRVEEAWEDKDLLNILYGTMPLYVPTSHDYWREHRGRFLESYHLTTPVFRATAMSRMTDHRYLSQDRSLQQTRFDNGWEVTANFSAAPAVHGGRTLAGKGFHASDGIREISMVVFGDVTVAAARLEDRLYLAPRGGETVQHGIRTAGAVFFRKRNGYVELAWIGGQKTLDIHPGEWPWPMDTLSVSERDGDVPVTLEDLGNGWKRLTRRGNTLFYTLHHGLAVGLRSRKPASRLRAALGRSGPTAILQVELPRPGRLGIAILDALGRSRTIQVQPRMEAGSHSLTLRLGPCPSPGFLRVSLEKDVLSFPLGSAP